MNFVRALLGIGVLIASGLVFAPEAVAQDAADSAQASATAAAQTAAEAWLKLVDEADYGASYEAAASFFKAAVTKAQWEAAVTQARGPLEPFGGRTLLGAQYATSLPNAPDGEYVVMQYQTLIGTGGTAIETVTPMRDTDGAWRVSGYYVRPE